MKPPRPRPRSSAPRPQSCAAILDYKLAAIGQTKSALPTPEESLLRSAKSQPSVLVPIDTSASAFERFAATRASLRNLQVDVDKDAAVFGAYCNATIVCLAHEAHHRPIIFIDLCKVAM